jgi:hypothetical protein
MMKESHPALTKENHLVDFARTACEHLAVFQHIRQGSLHPGQPILEAV